MQIVFDENCLGWSKKDQGYNEMFLLHTEHYINDLIINRGYVYLNQICEQLGIGWDPKKDNPVFTSRIEFEIWYSHKNNSFTITILH